MQAGAPRGLGWNNPHPISTLAARHDLNDADDYARTVLAAARRLGLRVEDDLRNEKINFKVREHALAKVPALLVVGRKEAAERTVSVRRLGSDRQSVLPLDAALAALAEEAVAPDVRRIRQAA